MAPLSGINLLLKHYGKNRCAFPRISRDLDSKCVLKACVLETASNYLSTLVDLKKNVPRVHVCFSLSLSFGQISQLVFLH